MSVPEAISFGGVLQAAGARVDVQAKSQEIRDHLADVIRNYRDSLGLIQKVGQPSDSVYREQSVINAKLVSRYAFQAASASARLLVAFAVPQPGVHVTKSQSEFQRMQVALAGVEERIEVLNTEEKTLDEQLARSSRDDAKGLRTRLGETQGDLTLNMAMADALRKIAGMSDLRGQSGLEGDIERLLQSAPGITDTTAKVVPTPLVALDVERSSGIASQATALLQLLATRQALDLLGREAEALQGQALSLRTPLFNALRGMLQELDSVSQQVKENPPLSSATEPENLVPVPAATDAQLTQTTAKQFDEVTTAFETLSASAVPLSEEIIALEQSQANLLAWRTAVNVEYHDVLRSLLQRMAVILVALTIVLAVGEFWRRATVHYVKGLGRRRQQLGLRRFVTSTLCGIVLIFGFVTHFDSLATFAGFITAGLAVALQTILLSVAAYFFIIGKYGIRVGDRISVVNVTGDVVEVGLVRFYVMELAVSGLGFQPTGRIAVFSNAILFQAGTPLYKQMPGADYAWHEVTVMLKQGGDYAHAAQVLVSGVQHVYDGYKQEIDEQYQNEESAMDNGLNAPRIQSRVQFVDGGLELTIRFPVKITEASRITQAVAESMLQLIQGDDSVKQAVESQPVITAALKL